MADSVTRQATDDDPEALAGIVSDGDEAAPPRRRAAPFFTGHDWPFDRDPTPDAGAPT
jgi:hypothetical protein